jgi:methyl-accepting chemotaxis protein
MTYFEPWDWIISASSYRSEFSSLVDISLFREDVKAVTMGDSGYMYVMDSKGMLLVHPQLEGQSIWDSRDSNGHAYIQEMCRNKNGSIVYSWKNPDEDEPREKLVVYRYVEEFDWIIAGGAYADVLYAPLRKVRGSVLLVLLLTCGIAMLFSLLFGRAMGRRFSVLESVAARVEKGDLRGTGSITTDVNDNATPREILSVENAFHSMARSLARVVRGIAGMSREIAGSVGTVEGNAQAMVDASQRQLAAVTHVVENLERVSAAAVKVDVNMGQLDSAAEQGSAATNQLSRSLDAILLEVDQFSTFVQETHQAIQQMSSLASDIQSNTSALSGAVERSLASSSEVAHSIRSMDATTRESVRVTQSVAQRAHAGQDAVSRSIQGMSNIAVTFGAIDSAFTSLGHRVEAIEDIVQVIEGISKQTTMLALNAAIVAAQAGEHGRGFSVMADEIKRLADRTDSATGEIAGLIGSVKQERERTLSAMAAGLQTVQDGHTLAGEAGQAIASILDLTQQSQTKAAEMASATRAQVQGHTTIMDSVARIAEMNHGVLELTTRQHGFVGNITRGIDAALASLATVRNRIQEEAQDSKVVAQQINTISRMSNSVRQDSSQQHAASTAVVRDIEVIKDSASQILARSERVAGSLVALTERIASLKAAVGHFTTGPEHTTAPHRV